jgi:hypothetical protein
VTYFSIYEGGANVFGIIKKTTSYVIKKMYLLYIFPLSATHTYDFVALTSLTRPRKIILVVLQVRKCETGKAKDLSAPLCSF